MARREGVGAPKVEHQRIVGQQLPHGVHLERWERRRTASNPENGGALAIEHLHAREVRRRLRQIGEDRAHERCLGLVLEQLVDAALLPDGRVLRRADTRAAEGSRAMPRPDLDVVCERQEHRVERVVQLVGQEACRILSQQIRPANGRDEERVAGQHPRRRVRRLDENRNVLGRVPRRVKDCEAHVADGDRFAMRCFVVRKREPGARPCNRADARRRELAGAGNEVSVNVCLDRVDDRQAADRARPTDRHRRRAADRRRPPVASACSPRGTSSAQDRLSKNRWNMMR